MSPSSWCDCWQQKKDHTDVLQTLFGYKSFYTLILTELRSAFNHSEEDQEMSKFRCASFIWSIKIVPLRRSGRGISLCSISLSKIFFLPIHKIIDILASIYGLMRLDEVNFQWILKRIWPEMSVYWLGLCSRWGRGEIDWLSLMGVGNEGGELLRPLWRLKRHQVQEYGTKNRMWEGHKW